jgi:hypothetical protein
MTSIARTGHHDLAPPVRESVAAVLITVVDPDALVAPSSLVGVSTPQERLERGLATAALAVAGVQHTVVPLSGHAPARDSLAIGA